MSKINVRVFWKLKKRSICIVYKKKEMTTIKARIEMASNFQIFWCKFNDLIYKTVFTCRNNYLAIFFHFFLRNSCLFHYISINVPFKRIYFDTYTMFLNKFLLFISTFLICNKILYLYFLCYYFYFASNKRQH